MKGLLLPLLALAIAPAPLAAQYSRPAPSGSQPSRVEQQASQPGAPAGQPPATASRAEVLRAAICLAGSRNAAAAEALVATPPYSQPERDQAGRTLRVAQSCVRAATPIVTSAMALRAAIAEALYEARFAQPQAALTPPLAVRPLLQPEASILPEIVAQLTVYHNVAECAVTRQQDLVRALLATEPGAEAELPAVQALYPTFGACVPPGTRLRLDRNVIRGILAEALYRWSVVQREGSASPWAAPAAAAN